MKIITILASSLCLVGLLQQPVRASDLELLATYPSDFEVEEEIQVVIESTVPIQQDSKEIEELQNENQHLKDEIKTIFEEQETLERKNNQLHYDLDRCRGSLEHMKKENKKLESKNKMLSETNKELHRQLRQNNKGIPYHSPKITPPSDDTVFPPI
jgi:septal ring factor EnvC (AmiA/AmiB activator)